MFGLILAQKCLPWILSGTKYENKNPKSIVKIDKTNYFKSTTLTNWLIRINKFYLFNVDARLKSNNSIFIYILLYHSLNSSIYSLECLFLTLLFQ